MALSAAVVLAAGAGSRFGGPVPKMLAEVRGKPLVAHAVEAAVSAAIGPVYVVTGEADLRSVLPSECVIVPNPEWAAGLASSLRCGIAAARAGGADAVVVALGDQPGLTPESWRAVGAAATTSIAVATYDGRRGHPVRLASSVWELLPVSGDHGAGPLMRSRPELVTEVPCSSGTSADIDTEQDQIQFNSPTPSA